MLVLSGVFHSIRLSVHSSLQFADTSSVAFVTLAALMVLPLVEAPRLPSDIGHQVGGRPRTKGQPAGDAGPKGAEPGESSTRKLFRDPCGLL